MKYVACCDGFVFMLNGGGWWPSRSPAVVYRQKTLSVAFVMAFFVSRRRGLMHLGLLT